MVYWIVMDIGDQGSEIAVRTYKLSVKAGNKEVAFSVEHFVVGLAVPVEEIGELSAEEKIYPFKGFKPLKGWYYSFQLFHTPKPYHQMQVIGHKAIGEGVCDRVDVFRVFFEKIAVIFCRPEEILAPTSVSPDVVGLLRFKRYSWIGHVLRLFF